MEKGRGFIRVLGVSGLIMEKKLVAEMWTCIGRDSNDRNFSKDSCYHIIFSNRLDLVKTGKLNYLLMNMNMPIDL